MASGNAESAIGIVERLLALRARSRVSRADSAHMSPIFIHQYLLSGSFLL